MQNYSSKLHDALNHFRVTSNDLESIMAVAMERGATYADIYFEHAYSNNVRLIDNNVDNASSNIEYGAGVRVVVGDQTGYAYTEIATVDELLKAARMANRIASNGEKYNNVNIQELTNPNRYPILHHWEEKSLLDRKPWLE